MGRGPQVLFRPGQSLLVAYFNTTEERQVGREMPPPLSEGKDLLGLQANYFWIPGEFREFA